MEDDAVKIKFGKKKEGGDEEQIQQQTEQNDADVNNGKEQLEKGKEQPGSIRHVIKLEESESNADQETKQSDDNTQEVDKKQEASKKKEKDGINKQDIQEEPLKKQIEERKEYLKQIKEFDFRISENQKQIEEFSKQIGAFNENLDDLVSLYEIVSEQMNPFVGLSSVTKKRIEALENYSQDIDVLKTKMMEIESVIDHLNNRSGEAIKNSRGKIPLTPQERPVARVDNAKASIPRQNNEIAQSVEYEVQPVAQCDWEEEMSDDELEQIIEQTLDDITIDHEIEKKLMNLFDED